MKSKFFQEELVFIPKVVVACCPPGSSVHHWSYSSFSKPPCIGNSVVVAHGCCCSQFSFRARSHRMRKHIGMQTLWCCLQAVWTLLLTAVCSIICMLILYGAPRPVWTGPYVKNITLFSFSLLVLGTNGNKTVFVKSVEVQLELHVSLSLHCSGSLQWKRKHQNARFCSELWLHSRPCLQLHQERPETKCSTCSYITQLNVMYIATCWAFCFVTLDAAIG